MLLKNKLKSASLEISNLKIENNSGVINEIALKSVHKVYLNTTKTALYIWALYIAIATVVTMITFVFIDPTLAFVICISLLYFFNKKILSRNTYILRVEFKDKNSYSIKIPYKMKEEIKSLIWDIRTFLIKN
jgi:hypothetical protein